MQMQFAIHDTTQFEIEYLSPQSTLAKKEPKLFSEDERIKKKLKGQILNTISIKGG